MRLDFICPGEPKCGTTALHDIMRQHPNVCLPFTKEPRWLQDYTLCQRKDIRWFEEHYYGISEKNPQKEGTLYGEINPSFGVVSARRLYDIFGPIKIILMFRNPVDRLWSHFNHCLYTYGIMLPEDKANETYRECLSLGEAFELFCERNFRRIDGKIRYIGKFNQVLSEHRYHVNCEIYSRIFKRENIKIVLTEELLKMPEAVCKDLFGFLGLSGGVTDYHVRSNEGNYRMYSEKEQKAMQELEQQRIRLSSEGDQEKITPVIATYMKIRNTQMKKQAPPEKCVELLQEYFREDKAYIEDFLQKDLSDIWY